MKFCKACNLETERYTNGVCKICARKSREKWRHANQEKQIAAIAAWRAKNSEKLRSANAKYRIVNAEAIRERRAKYYAENAEKLRLASAKYRLSTPEYREKHRAAVSVWRKNNPDKQRAHESNRRARKIEAGGNLSPGLSARLHKLQRGKCACCGEPLGNDYHLDHIMPLALGGTNTDDNIQLLRSKCNLQKNAKHPVDFMQQRGFLL